MSSSHEKSLFDEIISKASHMLSVPAGSLVHENFPPEKHSMSSEEEKIPLFDLVIKLSILFPYLIELATFFKLHDLIYLAKIVSEPQGKCGLADLLG